MEEGTGAALTIIGVAAGIATAPAIVVAAGAGAVGIGAASMVGGIGLISTLLGALQGGNGLIRTYYALTEQDDFLDKLDSNDGIKSFYQVVDALAVIISLSQLLAKGSSALFKIEYAKKIKEFKDTLNSIKFGAGKVSSIVDEIIEIEKELGKTAKVLGFPEKAVKLRSKIDTGKYRAMIARLKEEVPLLKNRLRELDIDLENEAAKYNKLATILQSFFTFLKDISTKLISPAIITFTKASVKDVKEMLIKLAKCDTEELNDIITKFSLLANATEGHGVATGTLRDLRKQETWESISKYLPTRDNIYPKL